MSRLPGTDAGSRGEMEGTLVTVDVRAMLCNDGTSIPALGLGLAHLKHAKAQRRDARAVVAEHGPDVHRHQSPLHLPAGACVRARQPAHDSSIGYTTKAILRLIDNGATARDLVYLFGGQGTINVPSWAPDSRRIAFVAYPIELS